MGKADAMRSQCEKHPKNPDEVEIPPTLEEFCLREIDHVDPNTKLSHHNALLYIVDDNEAVIKMIIKGRSPTMRHVSRTHRVALDCLIRQNQLWPTNSSEIRRYPKPTRGHPD